jgi:uncharacterized cupredoxin-like copper-binding protein
MTSLGRSSSRGRALVLCVLLFGAVACGSGGGTTAGSTPTIRIILGHLRFVPAAITVKAGTTVNFILANSDAIDHEFFLGSEEAQKDHGMRMSGGHMMNGEEMASSGMAEVPATKTVNLTYTFSEPGTLIYGCHIDDHYPQGMKGTVTVTS